MQRKGHRAGLRLGPGDSAAATAAIHTAMRSSRSVTRYSAKPAAPLGVPKLNRVKPKGSSPAVRTRPGRRNSHASAPAHIPLGSRAVQRARFDRSHAGSRLGAMTWIMLSSPAWPATYQSSGAKPLQRPAPSPASPAAGWWGRAPCAATRRRWPPCCGRLKNSFARVRGGLTERFLVAGGAAAKVTATFLGWMSPLGSSNKVKTDTVALAMRPHNAGGLVGGSDRHRRQSPPPLRRHGCRP